MIDAAPAPAPAAIAAALTETRVQVTSGYRGARIVLYGAVLDPLDRPSDVVVIVRGPDQPVRIARKTRIAGVWINSRPVVFQGAPGFYMVASTRPLDRISGVAALRQLGAGVDYLAMAAPAQRRVETRYGVSDMVVSGQGPDYSEWRRAVVRLREQAHLYEADDRGVSFVDKSLFRAQIDLPTQAPIGRYDARIILFQGGKPVASRQRVLTVEKAGAERALYLFAHRSPWSYGIASVIIALCAGWGASIAFRRG